MGKMYYALLNIMNKANVIHKIKEMNTKNVLDNEKNIVTKCISATKEILI